MKFLFTVLGYPLIQENVNITATSKRFPSEEDRLAITELLNKKQALLVELQHYEANSASMANQDIEKPSSTMPTNTRLQVAVAADSEEVSISK